MEHVAIDRGGRESQVCIRSKEGKILLERDAHMSTDVLPLADIADVPIVDLGPAVLRACDISYVV
jgi:hypothetical protein